MKRGNTKDQRQDVIVRMWTEHETALRRYVSRRGGRADDIDDVVAETFLSLMRLSDHDLGCVTPGWLFTVAFRRLADAQRSQASQRRCAQRTAMTRQPGPSFDVELTLRLDTNTALSTLSIRQRQAIELRYLDDRSVAEVASQLNISYSAAESLLARGRRSIASA